MSPYEIVLITAMALITFAIRYTLSAAGHRVRFSPWVTQALNYVPVAVLTAIVAPAMLLPDRQQLDIGLENAYLVGGIVAIVLAARWRNLLVTIVGAMICFFAWRWWLG
ncbi:AzlD domain-containing protein [Halopseudomonas sp.]|uniref:AzlD domain-containing protein n=1 Tax=Halopseudomonas sp. TaxID=2901191 RepID=UPI0035695C4A